MRRCSALACTRAPQFCTTSTNRYGACEVIARACPCSAGPYTAVAVGPNADVEAARAWQRPGSELLWALLPAGARHSLYVVHLGYNDVISAYARSGGPCRTAPSHRRQAALSGMRVTEPQQAVKSLLLKVAIGIGQAQTSWLDCNVVHPGGTVREGGKADSMAWRGPEAKA